MTINPGGVPAAMPIHTDGELISEILIFDDGLLPNCFAQNQVLTVTLNAIMTSPASLATATNSVAVFDSAGANGLSVISSSSVPSTTSQALTIISLDVVRDGSRGDPTAGFGSGLLLHNLRFSTQVPPPNARVLATVSSSASGSRLNTSPATIQVGTVTYTGPLQLSTLSLQYAPQIVNSTTGQAVKLSNGGSLPITISEISTAGDASQSNTCGTVIAVNASCTMTVNFTPGDLGPRSGTVSISSNTLNSPQTITTAGSGIASPGVPTAQSISPTYVVAGATDFHLTVRGTNFAQGSTVQWNGLPRATQWIDVSTVTATIPAGDIVAAGSATITVVNAGSGASNALTMQIVSNPMPSSPFTYFLPHVFNGSGYATKITLVNPTAQTSNVVITYISQAGALLQTSNYVIPAAGTLRVTAPTSPPTMWAAVGADTTLNINALIEETNASGQVVNTFGFNQVLPETDLTIPVEFEPAATGTGFSRTVGVALVNASDLPNSLTLQLLDATGARLTSYVLNLPPLGQQALDLSQVSQIASALPHANFVGSLTISGTQPIAAVGLGDDEGPFAATPPVAGRSTAKLDDFTSICPSAADVARFQSVLSLSFESDPTSGTYVCRGTEGSANLTALQWKAYQALRILNATTFDAPLPFTIKRPYEWMTSVISGIRFRGDIASSFCCSPARVINIAVGPSFPALQTSGWLAPNAPGLDDIPSTIVRLARISEGFADSCAGQDHNLAEMGPWAATMDWYDFLAAHSFNFLDDSNPNDTVDHYRQVAAADARGVVASGLCSGGVVETQPAALDYGSQALGDPVGLRTVTVSAGTSTSFSMNGSSIGGDNASDFTIVGDNCKSNPVPPSCAVTVQFKPSAIGLRTAQLTLGVSTQLAPLSIPLQGFVNLPRPIPGTNFTYLIPHIVSGGGFVTKITIGNLSQASNDIAINYISQSGQLLRSDDHTIPPGGTLRTATAESDRFSTYTTQWAIVGSRQPIAVNLFFESGDTSGNVTTTVGFNSTTPSSNFLFPVEFAPLPGGSVFGRTAGLALSNPSFSSVDYTITLYDQQGRSLAIESRTLPPFGQTAIDLSTVHSFVNYLPLANFIGSVRVLATAPVAAIALEDDFGFFTATPVFPLN